MPAFATQLSRLLPASCLPPADISSTYTAPALANLLEATVYESDVDQYQAVRHFNSWRA